MGLIGLMGQPADYQSFNPCFSGMAFGTRSAPPSRHRQGIVSILVFLEWPLGLLACRGLFPFRSVSILVFLEWPLGPTRLSWASFHSFGFNPCFSGMAFGTRFHTIEQLSEHSFNPCFSGMAFGTHAGCRRHYTGGQFQSLFFWNGLWDSYGETTALQEA